MCGSEIDFGERNERDNCSLVIWGAAGALSDPSGQLVSAFATVIDNPIPPMVPFRDYLVATYGKADTRATTQSAARRSASLSQTAEISVSQERINKCPTLVIAGEHDPFASRELVSGLEAKIPNIRVEYVHGVGYDVYSEKTEWLTQTILDWLGKH